jgi:hypothetical protein
MVVVGCLFSGQYFSVFADALGAFHPGRVFGEEELQEERDRACGQAGMGTQRNFRINSLEESMTTILS